MMPPAWTAELKNDRLHSSTHFFNEAWSESKPRWGSLAVAGSSGALICASVDFSCQPAVVTSATPSFLPFSVCAVPSLPWQLPHLAFQVRSVPASSPNAAAVVAAVKARIAPKIREWRIVVLLG